MKHRKYSKNDSRIMVHVRMTEDERKLVEARALESRQSLTAYICSKVFGLPDVR